MTLHVARRSRAVARALDPDKTIQARQPLLGLPLPSIIAGVPVLGPILSPSPTPASSQSPPPNSNGGGSSHPNGGNSPSSNGGGNGNGGSSSNSGGNGNGGSSSNTGGSSSGGGSGGGGGSPSDSGTTGGAPPSSMPAGATPPSTTKNGATSTGVSQPSSSASNVNGGQVLTGNGSPNLTTSNGGSENSSDTSGGGASPIFNAGSLPDTIQSSMYTQASGTTSPTNGPTGVGVNNGTSDLANKHHLSSGAIAAIAIVLVLISSLIIAVVVLRRRSSIRRDERKNRWWFATNRTSQTYGDITDAEEMPAGTHTARSSFVTTIDHSEPSYIIPPFPPAMAELGRPNGSRPALIVNTPHNNNNNDTGMGIEDRRFSIGSATSDHSQYLTVHQRDSTNPELGVTTPMSVRPFSPSESFAFPKPPEPAAGGGGSPRPSSSIMRSSSNASFPHGLSFVPAFPVIVPSTPNKTSPTSSTNPPRITDPFVDDNPFEDSTVSTGTVRSFDNTGPTIVYSSTAAFSEIEIVRRPFEPTLRDELNVKVGDEVRVLHSFDDGWALVEKVPGRSDHDGRFYGGDEGGKGLIPVDCLREPGQELPAFIASKRVSSYGEMCYVY